MVVVFVAELADEKGLSLLEVMVAMFMVALISSSLMGGFVISGKMIKQSAQETRASSYAYAILEDLRARPVEEWTEIVADPGTAYGQSGQGQVGSSPANVLVSISLNEKSDVPSLYDVQVTVSWEEGGASRTLEMVTLLNAGLREETI